jgi:hypothetical protein
MRIILGKLSSRINFPLGLAYSSAFVSSDIFLPMSAN